MGNCCASEPSDKYEVSSGAAQQGDKAAGASKVPGGRSTSHKPKPPPVPDFGLASSHEVIKLLGRGGEGETWLCRDKEDDREVAIKLIKRPIPKPAIQVIKREIKIQADLGQGHINIVSADEVILTKTHLGLIMEYVPGEAAFHARMHACMPAPGVRAHAGGHVHGWLLPSCRTQAL